jgi:4-diphosphocytidyl-2-C-methyl-D-erythritol kinase
MHLQTKRARVRALAKLNLSLKVLNKRSDGYHELRTIFQTISLGDQLLVEYTPGSGSTITVKGPVDIPDNLVARAAKLIMEDGGITGTVTVHLAKKIPMGAGLGGGSSDAAAMLLALPVLAGRDFPLARLIEWGACLGSDVPFFLLGGAAIGTGQGSELYPLPGLRALPALLVTPGVHVSTAEAYASLNLGLTNPFRVPTIVGFQSCVWRASLEPGRDWEGLAENDFEGPVFAKHPRLESIKKQLQDLGARPALMTGSGSALFGIFRTHEEVRSAARHFVAEACCPVTLVGRRRYQALWRRRLSGHIQVNGTWPPQSRYAQ